MPTPTSHDSIFPIIVLRAIQAVFSVLVLSLSIHLITSYEDNGDPLSKLICVAALAGLLSLITSLTFAASTSRPFLRLWVLPLGDGVVFLLKFLVGVLFAKRLKSISCHRRYEDLTAQADMICEDSEVGDHSTYYACMNAYLHAIKAADRYCVIVTTGTVFVFATAVVLAIIGLVTYTRIGKVQSVAR